MIVTQEEKEQIPLASNQIRAHRNKKGEINFYMLVLQDHTSGSTDESNLAMIWFRSEHKQDDAMYLLQNSVTNCKWNMLNDPVIVHNMNVMTGAMRESIDGKTIDRKIVAMMDPANPMRDKVKAIKWLRGETGMGLKEAKEEVERIMDDAGLTPK